MKRVLLLFVFAGSLVIGADAGEKDGPKAPPAGFTSLFNGKDLSLWKNAEPGWKVGTKVTVALNDFIVVDNAVFLEGKIPAEGPIERQVHGTPLWFRNVYVREIKK